MAKILISPLGVGPSEKDVAKREYKKAEYKFEDMDESYKTPFFASALAQKLKPDRIIFIGTSKSMWEEVYRYFTEKIGNKLDENYWLELGSKVVESGYDKYLIDEAHLDKVNSAVDNYLKNNNPNAEGGSYSMLIKYGLNGNEIWENFDHFMRIEKKLKMGDEIYLDITHSFRSIPIFMYLMMDFINALKSKEIKLAGIYYGMLDIKDEIGYAPVVDLAPLFFISRWIRATNNFVDYGNGFGMAPLVEDKDLEKAIFNISELININYLVDLRTQINKLEKLLKQKEKLSGVFYYMAPELERFAGRFQSVNSDFDFQLEISRWFFENKRYSNGYICLLESILTGLCDIYGLNINSYDDRELMKSLLYNSRFRGKHAGRDKLYPQYKAVNDIRIRIAHAAYTDDKSSFRSDINNSEKYCNTIKEIFKQKELNDLPKVIDLDQIKASKPNKKQFC